MEKEQKRDTILALSIINNQYNAIYHRLARELGLSECALSILLLLCDGATPYTPGEVCLKLGESRHAIHAALRVLTRDGYLTLIREANKSQKELSLTPKGERIAEAYLRPALRAEEETLDAISDEDISACLDTFGQYVDLLEQNMEDAMPR